jgi:hypothetical protein
MAISTLRYIKVPSLLVAGAAMICLGVPVSAQTTASPEDNSAVQVHVNDASRADVARFSAFLDTHPEIAGRLQTDHSLIDNHDFVKHYSDLKKFLHDNPGVRDLAKRDPDAFMQRVYQLDRDRILRDRPLRDPGRESARLHQFMDSHPEIAEQVRRNPSLLDNWNFVKNHPALQTFLQDNPGIREDVTQDPVAFMHRADDFDRDAMNRNLADFNQFAGSHREIADQLRKDPSLIKSRDYVSDHPELNAFLRAHPEVSTTMRQNPDRFMSEEARFNNTADGRDFDGDRNAEQFHRFLDDHPEIAEQIRRDHAMAVNQEFIDSHPDLKNFYQANPEVRNQVRENPDGFMQQEDRFARVDNRGDQDFDHDHLASFQLFLGGHSDIAQDVSRNPGIVKDPEYIQNHPDLNNYLNANPGVRNDLMQNPQGFVKGTQQFNSGAGTNGVSGSGSTSVSGAAGTTGTTATPSHDPKSKH